MNAFKQSTKVHSLCIYAKAVARREMRHRLYG